MNDIFKAAAGYAANQAWPMVQNWGMREDGGCMCFRRKACATPARIPPRNCGTHWHPFCITWLDQLLLLISFQIFNVHLLGLNANCVHKFSERALLHCFYGAD